MIYTICYQLRQKPWSDDPSVRNGTDDPGVTAKNQQINVIYTDAWSSH